MKPHVVKPPAQSVEVVLDQRHNAFFVLGQRRVQVVVELRNKVPTLRIRSSKPLIILPDATTQIGIVLGGSSETEGK